MPYVVRLDGSSGCFVTSSAPPAFTGISQFIARVSLDDWTPAATSDLIGSWQITVNRAFLLQILTSGFPSFVKSTTGANSLTASSTVKVPSQDAHDIWTRTTHDTGTNSVDFQWAAMGDNVDTVPTVWKTISLNRAISAGQIFNAAVQAAVGAHNAGGTTSPAAGLFKRLIIRNAGVDVIDFNPRLDYVSGTSWTSSATGEVWTLQGTAAMVLDGSGAHVALGLGARVAGGAGWQITDAQADAGLATTARTATTKIAVGVAKAGFGLGCRVVGAAVAAAAVNGTGTVPLACTTKVSATKVVSSSAKAQVTTTMKVSGSKLALSAAKTSLLASIKTSGLKIGAATAKAAVAVVARLTATRIAVGEAGTGALSLVVATTQMQLAGATTTLTADRARTAVTLTATNADTTLDHNAPILELV